MRLLWTNHALDRPAGTEMVTCDLVRALLARGHVVDLYTSRPGALAEELRAVGVKVSGNLDELSGPYDLLHGQHLVETWLAMEKWPELPALFYCHGDPKVEWMETPPRHPRLRGRVITTCANLAGYLHRRGYVDEPVTTILPNAWNEARFQTARPPPLNLRRAVFFHNTLRFSDPEWQLASEVCARLGITLEGRGAGFGNRMTTPERELPEFDLVFSSGRSALESIVCGCAVVILALQRCGGWVSEPDFHALQASNFTRGGKVVPLEVDALAENLSAYDPNTTALLTSLVREGHALERVVSDLEAIHQRHAEDASASSPIIESPLGLLWSRHLDLQEEARRTRSELTSTRRHLENSRQTAAELRESLKRVETFCKGRWWLRPLLSKLRKDVKI